MPTISRFYGIIIKMYFQQSEHNPPHSHAIYNETVASINILNGKIIEGDLPPKALQMVLEWYNLHRKELIDMWDNQDFMEIEPLE